MGVPADEVAEAMGVGRKGMRWWRMLALVQVPDFSTPLTRMADSLAKMAGVKRAPRVAAPPAATWQSQDQAQPVARDAKDLSHA